MKSIITFICLFFSFNFGFSAPENKSPDKLSLIYFSKSKSELKKALRRFSELSDAQAECEMELKLNRIPAHCLKQLEMEREAGTLAREKYRRVYEMLNNLCELRVKHTRLAEINELLKQMDQQTNCAKRLVQRAQTLKYQNMETDAEGVYSGIRLE